MKIFKKHTLGPVAAVGVALLFQTAIMQGAAAAPKYSEWSAPVNLGPVINSGFYDYHTYVSKNGLSLFFGSDRPGGFSLPAEDQADLYVSHRASVNDPWGAPVNLGPTVNSAFGDGRPSLSRDEHYMYFQSNRPGAGGADIWVSWRENTLNDFGWQAPVILGPGVNSDVIDAGPTYFENEGGAPQLYFNSSRLGGTDIFMSELMADGSFGPAQLVTELSGPTVDVQPSIRHDGLEIFFHSDRDGSLGLDVWVATRESTLDPWSTPVNVGGAVNTSYDERFPFVSSDGETLYFTSGRPGGFGEVGTWNLYMSSRTKLRAAPKFSDWSAPVNLGPIINSAGDDQGPAISKNGLSLYITTVLPGGIGGIDMWVSQRASVEDPWSPPTNLGPNVNSPGTDGLPAFSRDGHWMYFNSDRPGGFGGFDLWASERALTNDDFGWQPAVNLGPGVNTASFDCCSSFFENEEAGTRLLYFTRELVAGDRDIYVSAQATDGSFGPATIVPELNSPQNDVKPTIRFDGLEIILLSNRPGSLGGNDLWSSTRETVLDAWSPPVNLGPTINTTTNDAQPHLSSDGRVLFFVSNRPGGFGGLDFYVTTRSLANAAQDHQADVVLQHTDGSVAFWTMDGTTIVEGIVPHVLAAGWQIVGAGDFNHDGESDIVLHHTDRSVAFWLMQGTTITDGIVPFQLPAGAKIVATGDFNKDGQADLVLQNVSGQTEFWFMDGTSVTGTHLSDPLPAGWRVAGTGRFDHNAATDIVLQHTDGSVAFWLMDGTTILDGVVAYQIPPAWQIVATGNYNSDNNTDIVLQHTDGSVAFWLMDGTTITQGVVPYVVPAGWQVVAPR